MIGTLGERLLRELTRGYVVAPGRIGVEDLIAVCERRGWHYVMSSAWNKAEPGTWRAPDGSHDVAIIIPNPDGGEVECNARGAGRGPRDVLATAIVQAVRVTLPPDMVAV